MTIWPNGEFTLSEHSWNVLDKLRKANMKEVFIVQAHLDQDCCDECKSKHDKPVNAPNMIPPFHFAALDDERGDCRCWLISSVGEIKDE